jgi:tetratricopeptide (TPR) repeat protein
MPSSPPSGVAQLAWTTANAIREGRLEEALAACETALALRRGDEAGQASVRTTQGAVLRTLGRLGEARACLVRALAVHEAAGDRRLAALTQQELGALDLELGEVDEATARLVVAAEGHAVLGDAGFETRARLRLGAVLHAAGRLEDARSHLLAAQARADTLEDPAAEATALALLGLLDHETGRLSSALVRFRDALARPSPLADAVALHLALARVRLERGLLAEAREEAGVAATLAAQSSQRHAAGLASLVLAVCASREGRLEEAGSHLAVAEERLTDHPVLIELVGVSRGHLDLARGDRDAAFARLGAVSATALRSVPVRLGMRLLRTALGST